MRAAGLCHSDLSAMSGVLPQPAPFVPGHEGAGDIVEVGEGVTGVAVGDRVLLSWIAPCGRCAHCGHGRSHLCVASLRQLSGNRVGNDDWLPPPVRTTVEQHHRPGSPRETA